MIGNILALNIKRDFSYKIRIKANTIIYNLIDYILYYIILFNILFTIV